MREDKTVLTLKSGERERADEDDTTEIARDDGVVIIWP